MKFGLKSVLKFDTSAEGCLIELYIACVLLRLQQILKFYERVISALKFELSGKPSQILVVNSCEWIEF